MKKKNIMTGVCSAVTAIALAGTILTGCGNKDANTSAVSTSEQGADQKAISDPGEENSAVENDKESGKHTVTFYDSDGTTVLDTVTVADGETAEPVEVSKDGYLFTGWYATPQMNHDYDFSQPVTQDVSIFGGFVSYQEDTRDWYVVGNGSSPVLHESNWGQVCADAQKMTREENADANIYTITLDLEKGDELQFAVDSSWHDQRGYGYLKSADSEDGKAHFDSAGGLGSTDTRRSNIKVKESGNYTFTLTTYPGEDTYDTADPNYSEDNKEGFNYNSYDSLAFTYNGAAAEAADTAGSK
jgi:hypothetical protein